MDDGTYMLTLDGLAPVTFEHGYTVGIKAFDPEGASKHPLGTLIDRWTDPQTFGGQTKERVYWDEVEIIESLLEAGNVARQRGELAIWDNLNNCEIRV